MNADDLNDLARSVWLGLWEERRPVLVDYEPGNMTKYQLVFVPLDSMKLVAGAFGAAIGVPFETGCMVSLVTCNGRSYPFDLKRRGWIEPGYVASKLGTGKPDGEEIALLLEAIGMFGRSYEGASEDD